MNTMEALAAIDEALKGGESSIAVWERLGRSLGLSAEAIVMRRRALRVAMQTATKVHYGTRAPRWRAGND